MVPPSDTIDLRWNFPLENGKSAGLGREKYIRRKVLCKREGELCGWRHGVYRSGETEK
uniref:Uncharacterized protein, isoform B n=1 Tax=Drosophila pseudoobscura pseudoobscura TaxID=46245 RepID=A0A0R3NXU3_DROPS